MMGGEGAFAQQKYLLITRNGVVMDYALYYNRILQRGVY